MKKKYIFVLESEDGDIFVGRQADVDNEIRNYEQKGEDIPFTTIGKIEEPSFGLSIGFSEKLIEWYDKKQVPDVEIVNKAVLAIIQLIR
jgi:hypothetical protein